MRCISGHDDLSPTEVAAQLPVTRQAVSKHLEVLMRAGLVTQTRSGRETRYSLTPQPMTEAIAWMTEIASAWDTRLTRLRTLLENE